MESFLAKQRKNYLCAYPKYDPGEVEILELDEDCLERGEIDF